MKENSGRLAVCFLATSMIHYNSTVKSGDLLLNLLVIMKHHSSDYWNVQSYSQEQDVVHGHFQAEVNEKESKQRLLSLCSTISFELLVLLNFLDISSCTPPHEDSKAFVSLLLQAKCATSPGDFIAYVFPLALPSLPHYRDPLSPHINDIDHPSMMKKYKTRKRLARKEKVHDTFHLQSPYTTSNNNGST